MNRGVLPFLPDPRVVLVPAVATLPSPWLPALLVVVLVLAVLGVSAVLRRLHVPPEITRKTAHVGTSVAVLPLAGDGLSPQLAAGLIAFFAALVWLMRKLRLLGFLDDVRRKGPSEYGFIVGVAFLAVASRGDAFGFRTSILILGVCDALAALAGKRFGRHRFAIGSGFRSLEGSFAFAASAFLIVVASRAAHHRDLTGAAVLAALFVAAIVAIVEAVSVKGLDNLSVPLAAYWLLADGTLAGALPSLGVHLLLGGVAAVLLLKSGVPLAFGLSGVLFNLGAAFFERGQRWQLALCVGGVAAAAMLSTRLNRASAFTATQTVRTEDAS